MANYPQAVGRNAPFVSVQPKAIISQRAVVSTDTNYVKGQVWIDESATPSTIHTHTGGGVWEQGDVSFATDAEAQAKTSTTNAVTPANLAAEGFLQYADVTLTAAQIKLLATTPISLVAAQGAGSVILFQGALLKLVYGSEVLVEPSAPDDLAIKYTDASGVAVSQDIDATGFITASANTYTNALPVVDSIVVGTGAENKALVLDNTGGNYTGNATGDTTLVIRTYYLVQSI